MERSPELGSGKRDAPRIAGYAREEHGGVGARHGGIARAVETRREDCAEDVVREAVERGAGAFQRREDEKQRRLFRLERGDLRVDCTDSAFVLCGETGEVPIFG